MRTLVACLFTLTLVGCGTQTSTTINNPSVTTTPVAFNAAGAPTIDIEVPSMDCEVCCESMFGDIAGVVDCKFDSDKKIATLAIDEATFDPFATLETVKETYADAELATAAE